MEATMYVDVSSDLRSVMDITDYAERSLVDRLGAVDGVASIRLSGGRRPAMRVWLDREALAARGLTVQDVERTLRAENVELPAGRIESVDREFTLRAVTALDTPEEFGALVIGRGASGRFVRLAEVADIRLSPENMRSIARSNRQAGVSLGIVPQAQANIVAVNQAVKEEVRTPPVLAARRRLRGRERGLLRVRRRVHARSVQGPGDRAGRGAGRDAAVFEFLARHADSRAHDPGVDHRRLHGAGGPRLHDQHAHAAGRGAGHRTGGGRRHRGAGEHRAPPRAGQPAAAGGHRRQPPDRLRRHRHHRGAGRVRVFCR